MCRGAFGHRFGGRAEPVYDGVIAALVGQQFGRRAQLGQVVQHVVDVLVRGRPGVEVAGLRVAADHPYELALREQVPDDAAVLEHGLDAARPHGLEHRRRRYGAGRPFGEVHFDVRVAGQPEVRRVVHHERGLVVGRKQLVHQTHFRQVTNARPDDFSGTCCPPNGWTLSSSSLRPKPDRRSESYAVRFDARNMMRPAQRFTMFKTVCSTFSTVHAQR